MPTIHFHECPCGCGENIEVGSDCSKRKKELWERIGLHNPHNLRRFIAYHEGRRERDSTLINIHAVLMAIVSRLEDLEQQGTKS